MTASWSKSNWHSHSSMLHHPADLTARPYLSTGDALKLFLANQLLCRLGASDALDPLLWSNSCYGVIPKNSLSHFLSLSCPFGRRLATAAHARQPYVLTLYCMRVRASSCSPSTDNVVDLGGCATSGASCARGASSESGWCLLSFLARIAALRTSTRPLPRLRTCPLQKKTEEPAIDVSPGNS